MKMRWVMNNKQLFSTQPKQKPQSMVLLNREEQSLSFCKDLQAEETDPCPFRKRRCKDRLRAISTKLVGWSLLICNHQKVLKITKHKLEYGMHVFMKKLREKIITIFC